MSTCFLIGSHLSPDALSPLLDEAIERHIAEYGVTEFLVGRYGRFDQLAAEALRRAKERHPGIRLRLLIPYHPAQRPVDVPSGFDGTYYPEGMETVPKRLAILRAGQMAAGESEYLIASPGFGGSRTITDYALRREKRGLIQVTLLKAPWRPPFCIPAFCISPHPFIPLSTWLTLSAKSRAPSRASVRVLPWPPTSTRREPGESSWL